MDGFAWFKIFSEGVDDLVGGGFHGCSLQAHALFYSTILMTVVISVGGFYVWRRFIKTKKVVGSVF